MKCPMISQEYFFGGQILRTTLFRTYIDGAVVILYQSPFRQQAEVQGKQVFGFNHTPYSSSLWKFGPPWKLVRMTRNVDLSPISSKWSNFLMCAAAAAQIRQILYVLIGKYFYMCCCSAEIVLKIWQQNNLCM